ncbi:MAG TPA: ATP-binding protein [Jatrophihabitans sp.]
MSVAGRAHLTPDRLSDRLRYLVLSMLVIVVAVGIAGLIAVRVATGQVDQLTKGYNPAIDTHTSALIDMLNAETGIRGYVLTGNKSFLQPYLDSKNKVVPTLNATKATLNSVGEHGQDASINVELARANAWLNTYAAPIVATRGKPNISDQRQNQGKTMFNSYRTANNTVSAQLQNKRDNLRAQSTRIRGLAFPTLIAIVVIAILVAIALAVRSARRISRPLTKVWSVVRRLNKGDLNARADEDDGPAEVRDLAHAVNALAIRSSADSVAEREAELFRQRTRLISSTIRRTTNGAIMADHLARGLGSAFEVDRVWLRTFPDDRVPSLTAQWHVERLADLDDPVDEHVEATRSLASRLWESAQIVTIDDHRSYQPSEQGQLLFKIVQKAGATSSMVVPIGDSSSAFGLVWISMVSHPRHWTMTEAGVAQHLAADLAHSLMQAHLIERQAQAVQMLQELDQAKSDFISTVSHELRTPLTSITGYLELLTDGEVGDLPPSASKVLQVIDRNATRLRNLIEDLLTQSRIDAGRLRLDMASVDVAEVLRAVQAAMTPLAASSDVLLDFDCPVSGTLQVYADAPQLEQVFTNLVSNAVKFTPSGGKVSVVAEHDEVEGGVFAQVIDNGIGIPERDIPNLFTRFFRASNASASVTPGTGLGLAIVHEIVQRHGGEVDVESELGRGSTFSVWLPTHPPLAI